MSHSSKNSCNATATTGTFTAKPHSGGQKRRLDAAVDQRILAWIQAQADPGSGPGQALTLAQLQTKTRQELGISLSLATLCRSLKRLGLTRKKGNYIG